MFGGFYCFWRAMVALVWQGFTLLRAMGVSYKFNYLGASDGHWVLLNALVDTWATLNLK
jgi:hypothetical protein